MEEIKTIEAAMKAGTNPRDFKLKLAFEITKQFLGEDAAQQGQAHFEQVIQNQGTPEDMEELTPSDPNILTVLLEAKMAGSSSEARRLIKGNGVKINGEAVSSIDQTVTSGDIVQKGKRFFVKIA
jgi:tyrosyl-tRNA synthetase